MSFQSYQPGKRQQQLGNIYIYKLKLLKELLLFGWTCASELFLFIYLFVSIYCLQQSESHCLTTWIQESDSRELQHLPGKAEGKSLPLFDGKEKQNKNSTFILLEFNFPSFQKTLKMRKLSYKFMKKPSCFHACPNP